MQKEREEKIRCYILVGARNYRVSEQRRRRNLSLSSRSFGDTLGTAVRRLVSNIWGRQLRAIESEGESQPFVGSGRGSVPWRSCYEAGGRKQPHGFDRSAADIRRDWE